MTTLLPRPGAVAVLAALVAVFLGAILHGAPREQLAAVDERWLHVRSPNFELYSHNAEAESRKLLRDLELLRALVTEQMKFVERSRVEVTVYAFRKTGDFRAYTAEAHAGNVLLRGFYLPQPDRAIINLAPINDQDASQRLVFHEYVHHMFRAAEQNPPLWFNEGTAELFAAIREQGDMLEIGRPHEGRLAVLRTEKLLPLEKLFAVDHGSPIYRATDHKGLFYAQSWALLHYWQFGESGLAKDAVMRFLRIAGDEKLAANEDLRAHFRTCFGMDYPEMEKRLERYVETGSYRFGRVPVPTIAPVSSYVVRAVPRDEIRVRLAELALRVNRSSMAKSLLLDAAAKEPKDPRVLEALGTDAAREGDPARACEWWEQALAAGGANPAIFRELSLVESRRWFKDFDQDFRLPEETARKLRERLQRAISFEPQQTVAYETLAWVEAFSDTPYVPHVNLVQRAFPRLRQQPRTLLALALVRLRANRPDEAKALLDDMDKLEWDRWAAQGAEEVRARLEGRSPRFVVQPGGGGSVMTDSASRSQMSLRIPSIELPKR